MSDVLVFAPGGYRYIRAVFQYSGGVAAEPGYEVERARFMRPLPLADAFVAIEAESNAFWTLTKGGLVQKWSTAEFANRNPVH